MELEVFMTMKVQVACNTVYLCGRIVTIRNGKPGCYSTNGKNL